MSYTYSLPTTGAMSFVEFLKDVGSYSSEISDATAQRGRIRTVLKELKKEAQEERDYRHIVNTIEDYLPYLISVINCLESGELKLKKSIETSWRSTLSDHIIHTGSNAPRIACQDIYYELLFVLMTYGYACSMQSNDIFKTIQEGSSTASAQYNKAADSLNTAASVFNYVAYEVIPKWKQAPESRPVETIKELPVALSKMALADAQYIAINKALLTGNVSKSLVAKLYIGVAGQYEMAYGLVSSISGTQEVSTDLKKYIFDGAQFYKAMGKKKMGEAVGFLRECKADLRSIQHSSLSKPHLRKSAVASRAFKEEEAVSELLQKFTMINDTVTYQNIPSRQDLLRIIPNGRGVLQMKRYQLPSPRFGPTQEEEHSANYARSGAYY
ncbi:BRO1 domain-containing protein [Zychaea mexicana]|uniref:BRO1 domain-containing protein n=1 Tax=Zychaea mexicana TaxID=64656 RepID=UPI0022FF0152|nr:BRO1 domain-containing protein [Zychaea mexicana]KAI9496417.1 BRO1 domain-containing protein [Zychaea mexicana]